VRDVLGLQPGACDPTHKIVSSLILTHPALRSCLPCHLNRTYVETEVTLNKPTQHSPYTRPLDIRKTPGHESSAELKGCVLENKLGSSVFHVSINHWCLCCWQGMQLSTACSQQHDAAACVT
jgi:hypothetical protein